MNLFSKERATEYFRRISSNIEREINALSDEKIISASVADWGDYYREKYAVTPITLFENESTQTVDKDSKQIPNVFYTNPHYDSRYLNQPAYRINFTIPFDGTADLLFLIPSSRILTEFEAEVVKPVGDKLGSITISLIFSVEEMKDKPDLQSFVRTRFDSQFANFRKMIGYINSEVAQYNTQLHGSAIAWLQKRKDNATEFSDICARLDIPMTRSENAPNSVPIPLKRVVKQMPIAPQAKKLEPEYGISDIDYQNIENIIDMFCISCEKTALTYSKLKEEEIRDTLIATLNTHYSNVTGEAFRKKGKTDILVEFDNKAGFIAECKIWHGIQALEDALTQLSGYMTWRDYKVTLIFFNKRIKNFTQVRNSISEWVQGHATNIQHKDANIWKYTVKRSDRDEEFQLSIHVYDLYIAE